MDAMEKKVKKQKRHQHKQSGPKAEKKKLKKQESSTENAGRRNPKAFAVQSAVRMAKTFHRSGLMLGFFIRHIRYMKRAYKCFYFQGSRPQNQKASHPWSWPQSFWTSPSANRCGWTPQSWKEYPDPLLDQKLYSTEAWGDMWPCNYCLR